MGREGMEMAVTSMQITDVTWAPILMTHAVDNPFPKAAARPSCGNQHNNHHIKRWDHEDSARQYKVYCKNSKSTIKEKDSQ